MMAREALEQSNGALTRARVFARNGRLLTPQGVPRGTQRIPIRVCRYYRLPSGRLSWTDVPKSPHVSKEWIEAPLHLPGILAALARRFRHGSSGSLPLYAFDRGGGLSLRALKPMVRNARAGVIAVVQLDNLLPPYRPQKDADLSETAGGDVWTYLPEPLRARQRSVIAVEVLSAFTDEQLRAVWRYHKRKPTAADREFSRRSKAFRRLLPMILPQRGERGLSIGQVERLLSAATKMRKGKAA